MKKLCIPILALILLSCTQTSKQQENEKTTDTPSAESIANIRADTATSSTGSTPEKSTPIAFIRSKVEHINTISGKTKHFEFVCDEKTKVNYLYEGNEIVKISVDFGTVGDAYAKEDYYYHSGDLIFKYEFVEGGPACEGCIKKDEYRSYISKNKVIKYLKNKTVSECRKCEFTASSKEYKLLQAKSAEEIKNILCR